MYIDNWKATPITRRDGQRYIMSLILRIFLEGERMKGAGLGWVGLGWDELHEIYERTLKGSLNKIDSGFPSSKSEKFLYKILGIRFLPLPERRIRMLTTKITLVGSILVPNARSEVLLKSFVHRFSIGLVLSENGKWFRSHFFQSRKDNISFPVAVNILYWIGLDRVFYHFCSRFYAFPCSRPHFALVLLYKSRLQHTFVLWELAELERR